MKKIYKNVFSSLLGAAVCLLFSIPADAQHNNSGGGGGGSRSSGGGGSAPAAHSSGGGSGFRPSSGGSAGVSRPPAAMQRPQGNYGSRGVGVNGNYGSRGVGINGSYGYSQRTGAVVRGNYGYAPRGVSGAGYRTAPRVGYGGFWGNHGYVYHNRGYYNTYYLPRLGFTCSYLPYGYYPFYFGDSQYFYSDGLYYQYGDSEYTVVDPPVGAEIATLPDKSQSIVINGQQYYELNGVYYQPVTKDDGTVVYQIAGKDGELNTGSNVQDDQPQGPQMGDVVNQLPPDCRKIKVNGAKLWVSPDGVYYQEQADAAGNKVYKVVGLPSDENDQQN